ncbi:MAG: DnaA/Hda family protein [Pseudomonadota bacterium]
MKPVLQLPLDLPHRPAYGREDFMVAPSNQAAVALIDAWPRWPQPVAALYGPRGSGKTHLGQVWRRSSDALELSASSLAGVRLPKLISSNRAILLTGLEQALGDDAVFCEQLLHLYNMVLEEGVSLLLIGLTPPARWQCDLADLKSRLSAVQAVALGQPDEALISAILIKHFSDRQLRVTPEILDYILPRMERSFAAADHVVAAIDRAALARKSKVSLSLVREALAEVAGSKLATG